MTFRGIGARLYYAETGIRRGSDQGPSRPEREFNRKMRSEHKMDLKKQQRCATFQIRVGGHSVCPSSIEEGEMSYHCNFLRQHFMQASDQKTPDLKEKSRAALIHLDVCEAHPVSMLFSGAGVPLIGMFQGVASLLLRFHYKGVTAAG